MLAANERHSLFRASKRCRLRRVDTELSNDLSFTAFFCRSLNKSDCKCLKARERSSFLYCYTKVCIHERQSVISYVVFHIALYLCDRFIDYNLLGRIYRDILISEFFRKLAFMFLLLYNWLYYG